AEIISKFDEIVAFAEIEQFLDTPVKHYSSGMYVRLAFAVAAHLNPEILVVDEVLAVGDAAFQKKCLGKMNAVSRGGRTVLFVSHNMAAVENLCQRGIVLERGRAVFDGSSKDAVHHYLTSFSGMPDSDGHIIDLSAASRISVVGQLLRRMELYTDEDRPLLEGMKIGARLKVKIHFDLPNPTNSFNIGLGFNDFFGQRMFTAHSHFYTAALEMPFTQALAKQGHTYSVVCVPYNQLFTFLLDPRSVIPEGVDASVVLLLRVEDLIRLELAQHNSNRSDSTLPLLRQRTEELVDVLSRISRLRLTVMMCPSGRGAYDVGSLGNSPRVGEHKILAALRSRQKHLVVSWSEFERAAQPGNWFNPAGDRLGHVPFMPEGLDALADFFVGQLNRMPIDRLT